MPLGFLHLLAEPGAVGETVRQRSKPPREEFGLPDAGVGWSTSKSVGNGEKALVYLGRYLYRGVIQERDILRCENGQVTFRYRDSSTGKNTLRTVSGAYFLWLVLQHVLPKGFRRSRNFGLLHPNCKHRQRLTLLRMGLRPGATAPGPAGMQPSTQSSTQPPLSERPKLQCRCCGAAMVIVRRRIAPLASTDGTAGPLPGAAREGTMH